MSDSGETHPHHHAHEREVEESVVDEFEDARSPSIDDSETFQSDHGTKTPTATLLSDLPGPGPGPDNLNAPLKNENNETVEEVHANPKTSETGYSKQLSHLRLDELVEPDPDHPSFVLVASLRSQITDLSSQVTSLNSKLVTSYTRIGDLEDDLHDKLNEHSRLNSRLLDLETEKSQLEKEIAHGGWVERSHVQAELTGLMNKVMEETKSRALAVEAHDKLETEIENLTSSLFSEANKMVAVERFARARADEKMKTLEESTNVMTGLFDELQTSLRDKVEQLEAREAEVESLRKRLLDAGISEEEGGEEDGNRLDRSTEEGPGTLFSDGKTVTIDNPSTSSLVVPSMHRPILSRQGSRSGLNASLFASPRLNTSVLPYNEFIAFVTYLRQLRISTLARPPPEHAVYAPYHASISGRSFGAMGSSTSTLGFHPGSPLPTPTQLLAPHLPLSSHTSQPFIKRCVEEDSDACLRLDLAPAFNIISRRAVATAVLDGTLLIEPAYTGTALPSATCALCGVSLEKWWGGGEIATPASIAAKNINQTVRKVLSSGGWSISSFTHRSSSSTPTTPPANSISHTHSTTAAGATESGFSFPVLPHQQIHIFRVNETSSSRYAICPTYCLPRLRTVCELWTYVRAIERGLLLEDGFQFVGDRGVNGTAWESHSRTGSGSSLNLGRSKSSLNVVEKASESPVGAPPDRQTVEAPTIHSEKVEAKATEEAEEKEEEEPKEETDKVITEDTEAERSTDADGAEKHVVGSPIGNNASSTSLNSERPDTSSSIRPPVPKRSGARPTTPVLGSGEFSTPQPITIEPKAVTPRLPPRRASSTPTSPKQPMTGVKGGPLSETLEIAGGATGWEDRCWVEVVRLKEAVFWSRVAREQVPADP